MNRQTIEAVKAEAHRLLVKIDMMERRARLGGGEVRGLHSDHQRQRTLKKIYEKKIPLRRRKHTS